MDMEKKCYIVTKEVEAKAKPSVNPPFTKGFTPFLKPLSAYSSCKLIIRRKVFNKEMLRLLIHHATLKMQPDPVRMHEYYKGNFDYDPP
jgi:hypothetical protein